MSGACGLRPWARTHQKKKRPCATLSRSVGRGTNTVPDQHFQLFCALNIFWNRDRLQWIPSQIWCIFTQVLSGLRLLTRLISFFYSFECAVKSSLSDWLLSYIKATQPILETFKNGWIHFGQIKYKLSQHLSFSRQYKLHLRILHTTFLSNVKFGTNCIKRNSHWGINLLAIITYKYHRLLLVSLFFTRYQNWLCWTNTSIFFFLFPKIILWCGNWFIISL